MGGTITQFSIEPPDQTTKFEVEAPTGSDPASNTPGFFKRLVAPYNPQVEDSNVLVRGLDAAGGALLSTPGAVYHAFADAPTAEEQAKYHGDTGGLKRVGLGLERLITDPVEGAVKDYSSGKVTPSAALSVLPEAIGVGVGSQAAGELAGRGLSKVGELRTQFKDSMGGGKVQPFVRKVVGVEGDLKKAVNKAAETTAKAEEAHGEATETAAQRQALARTLDETSMKAREHIGKVEESVAKEANAKFKAVREKLGITDDSPGPEVPPDRLVATVRNIESQTLQDIPENVKEFRAILGHAEEVPTDATEGVKNAFREKVKQEPLGGLPFTWDKLQSLKSRIDARLRNSRGMNGDLKRGLRQARDGVVEEMGTIAEPHGAGGLWVDARDFYRGYKQDFHEPTGPSDSGSPVAKALDAVDPAAIRRPFAGSAESTLGNRGAKILRKYPQHGGEEAASTVEEMVGHHQNLRRMGADRAIKPVKTLTVDATQTARDSIARRAARVGDMNARDVGIIASGGIGELLGGIFGGNLVDRAVGAATGVGMYEGGKYAISRALNNPKVIEWLEKTPPEEVAVLNKIKGADKVRIINALTEQATKAGRPVKLSPEARQLIGPANAMRIAAASGAVAGQQIQNRKDALDLLNPVK